MHFQNVFIESFGYVLPDEVISSAAIESRLAPLYSRLKLPEGRLELITGIGERRFWPPGMLPSEQSIASCQHALRAADWDPSRVGALIHASVCRDHLEPATACRVHYALGLRSDCVIYDVSNACLGLMNGVVQIAQMIELGQIVSGLVVGTEVSRPLVETTIASLNADRTLTRGKIKSAIASLTIGSGSCAILVTSGDVSRTRNRLGTAVVQVDSSGHALCHSGADEAVASGMQPLMETDSETLMHAGVALGRTTFETLLAETNWQRSQVNKSICHQVGSAHRRMMLESLQLPLENDYTTVEWLGNTGSVALPISMALAAQEGYLASGDRVALLGIGSGINSVMMGVDWSVSCVEGHDRHA